MTCPTCGAELRDGSARCPVCEALVAPSVEGALATKPAPLRDLPGTRKKEKTWRDEVNERVRSRRKKREEETGLPLFDQAADAVAATAATPAPEPTPVDDSEPPLLRTLRRPQEAPRLEDAVIAQSPDEPVGDLPLHARAGPAPDLDLSVGSEPAAEPAPRPPAARPRTRDLLESEGESEGAAGPRSLDEDEWRVELEPPAAEPRPLERPALLGERVQAGAADLGVLSLLGLVVVYFASRAARVPLAGLLPAWPWLVGYLAFLGLAYATYFTGTTGQTPGKMLLDLRVVDTAGQPPGYLRAFLRAALGGLTCAAAGLGALPMAFDPARRGLHDRALRTRVVRG